MSGARSALVIATTTHADAMLERLASPTTDALALAAVLGDTAIGDFDTDVLINAATATVTERLETFFLADRRPDDLLLLYITGHGVKDPSGRLFFAMTDTRHDRLRSTAVPAAFIHDVAQECRARSQVVMLDCCYAGAFLAGVKGDDRVGSTEALQGRGRAVLTATDALQYAFQGEVVEGRAAPSVFTAAIVEGLRDGGADVDGDGVVSVDDLYDFVYERVTTQRPDQRPSKTIFEGQGAIVIARVPRAESAQAPPPAASDMAAGPGAEVPPAPAEPPTPHVPEPDATPAEPPPGEPRAAAQGDVAWPMGPVSSPRSDGPPVAGAPGEVWRPRIGWRAWVGAVAMLVAGAAGLLVPQTELWAANDGSSTIRDMPMMGAFFLGAGVWVLVRARARAVWESVALGLLALVALLSAVGSVGLGLNYFEVYISVLMKVVGAVGAVLAMDFAALRGRT